MIDDADILRALQPTAAETLTRSRSRYSVRVVSTHDGIVHLELAQGQASARVRINMPSSGLPMPWLYAEPEDAVDWVEQLFVFLDEEVDTRGLGGGRVREDVHGGSYVIVTGYGFKLADKQRHDELEKKFGTQSTIGREGLFGWRP